MNYVPKTSLTSSRTVHSVTVEKLVECFVVVSFGLKGATVDCQRELLLRSRSATVVEVVAHLEESLNVGVCVFHVFSMAGSAGFFKGEDRPG